MQGIDEKVKVRVKKLDDQYIFSTDDGRWSFYDENNRPIGIYYDSIEKAVDGLYKYLELIV